jgi:L-iditol 2-dehydrogenase
VFASEPLEHRRAAAARVGDGVWAPEDIDAGVLDATGGRGVDVAIEAAGNDAAVDTAVSAVRPGARVALAGIPDVARSSFSASAARRKGLTFTMIRRMHDTYPQAIHLATTGVDLDALVSDRYPLEQGAAAFDAAAARVGTKTVVTVS